MKREGGRVLSVLPQPSGEWTVLGPAAGAEHIYPTRGAAVRAAEEKIRTSGGELRIHAPNGRVTSKFTLGRSAMEKINAVEGIALSRSMQQAFERYDREGLSPADRRKNILASVTKKKP